MIFLLKQLKADTFSEKKVTDLIAKAWESIKEHLYYPVESFYHTYIECIGRAIAFARIGWRNYDFDFACTYTLLVFKMKRVRNALINGNAIQEKADMDALDEAIRICERLRDDDYDRGYQVAHDLKWGELQDRFEPILDKNNKSRTSSWITWRSGVNTKEEKEREFQDQSEIFKKAERDWCNDLNKLNEILKIHSRSWWD